MNLLRWCDSSTLWILLLSSLQVNAMFTVSFEITSKITSSISGAINCNSTRAKEIIMCSERMKQKTFCRWSKKEPMKVSTSKKFLLQFPVPNALSTQVTSGRHGTVVGILASGPSCHGVQCLALPKICQAKFWCCWDISLLRKVLWAQGNTSLIFF